MRIPCPIKGCKVIVASKRLLPKHIAKKHPGEPFIAATDPAKRAMKKLKKIKAKVARRRAGKYARRRRNPGMLLTQAQAERSWVKPEGAATRMRSIAQELEAKAKTLRTMADELDNLS